MLLLADPRVLGFRTTPLLSSPFRIHVGRANGPVLVGLKFSTSGFDTEALMAFLEREMNPR